MFDSWWNIARTARGQGIRTCLVPWGLLFLLGALESPAADHTTYVVRVPLADAGTLERIEDAGGIVDDHDGRSARVYVHVSRWPGFQSAGLSHTVLELQPAVQKQLSGYPSYRELTTIVNDAATDYPEIVRLVSLGQSVQGREIWALRITDFPDAEEDEPEFTYISTMHGDEKIGTVLCLNFLELLLSGYGTDGYITALIDDTDLWLVPLMNPDGYELNIRWNANNRDLNRSFPIYPDDFTGTLYTDGAPPTTGREPEVAHIINWTASHSFVLGANYHSGALVVNYPYDEIPGVPSGADAPTPDDALMRDLSFAYADLNPPMSASLLFPGGITNGSAWYSIDGGMQDWYYRFAGTVHVTLEVSATKTPSASSLAGFWEDNREAMFAYLGLVHRSARGLVTDRMTGAPLNARILVDDNPQPVFTDPDVGDYHRLLLPGSYTLRAESPGYIPYTLPSVTIGEDQSTRADISLSTGDINGDDRIDAVDLQLVINSVLGILPLEAADVDGRGVSATDVQHLVNRVLRR